MKKRKMYMHKHPRGFSNECDVFLVENPVEKAEAESEGYIKVRDILSHFSWMNSENDSLGSDRAFGVYSAGDVQKWSERRGLR